MIQLCRHPPQRIITLQLLRGKQLFLSSCAGFHNIHRREDSPLCHALIQHQLHVAGALEFLKHNLIHFAARIHKRSCKNRQTSAVFNISGCAKEPLRHIQRRGVQTTGQRASAWRNRKVIRTRQTSNAVQQDN